MSDPVSPLDGLMPVKEFAQQRNKSTRTIMRWAEAGLLTLTYLGRDPFINVKASNERLLNGARAGRGRPRKPIAASRREDAGA